MSKELNLEAEIISGKSAAGFDIGMHIDEISHLLKGAKVVEYFQGFNLVKAINETEGYFLLKGFCGDKGGAVYYGNGLLRLEFNDDSLLYCIYVYRGYNGCYKAVKIGDPLNKLREVEKLLYDEGDDMHYRVLLDGNYASGLAIVGLGDEDEFDNDDPIEGFCIHDWAMQNA